MPFRAFRVTSPTSWPTKCQSARAASRSGPATSYAVSYRMQKMIESIAGGRKPDMLASGHYHKAETLPSYRNVFGVDVGCFEDQTPFMASRASAAHVGG